VTFLNGVEKIRQKIERKTAVSVCIRQENSQKKETSNTVGSRPTKGVDDMKKILILNGHPDPGASTAGKAVLEAFVKLRPDAQVRMLSALCGKEGYDVAGEQAALVGADVVVWHFPFYWYSVSALMKKWIDDVLTRGFAYGSGGTALCGKHLLISFTTGAPEEAYAAGKPMNWPVEAFLPPLLQTANLCGLKILAPVWSTGMSYIPEVPGHDDLDEVLARARAHAERMAAEISALETAE
jgi:glutathione-regulated potassium-efflux system ancillary protein KefF